MCWCAISVEDTNGTPGTWCGTSNKMFLFHFFKRTNGASGQSAPLVVRTTNGAPAIECATTVFFLLFCKTTNGAPPAGAPLVTRVTNGAFVGGAPLVTWDQLDIFGQPHLHTHFPHFIPPHLLL